MLILQIIWFMSVIAIIKRFGGLDFRFLFPIVFTGVK
jgi:hypothetical protein